LQNARDAYFKKLQAIVDANVTSDRASSMLLGTVDMRSKRN
jgi:hypothetical protein